MGKLDTNKKVKEDSLLNTAFSLFTTKGVSKTSISDIVNNAGVAKGTFYLYKKQACFSQVVTAFQKRYRGIKCERQEAYI